MRRFVPAIAATVTLTAVGLLALAPMCRSRATALPKLAAVPAFELRDQDGKSVGRDALRGTVWVANFMFTSCPDVCPILTSKMAGVRTQLVADRVPVKIVSFSVDPATDTPEVLKKYARERSADYPDWRFLTGPLAQVQQVIIQGFKQSLQVEPARAGEPQAIMHGSHFVLVDRDLNIRGYYPSDDEGLLRLTRDARIIANEPKDKG